LTFSFPVIKPAWSYDCPGCSVSLGSHRDSPRPVDPPRRSRASQAVLLRDGGVKANANAAFHHPARGCAPRATLGPLPPAAPTLKGLHPVRRGPMPPRWGWRGFFDAPRVGAPASRQPWAEGWNAVGVRAAVGPYPPRWRSRRVQPGGLTDISRWWSAARTAGHGVENGIRPGGAAEPCARYFPRPVRGAAVGGCGWVRVPVVRAGIGRRGGGGEERDANGAS